ncbi:hypothetical protein RND81_01G053400 [Saponaria officinalis]|uniref:MD-2-related lipid-recognition domain-containing protein n=1 Tax=Saponaria officinalis TaxID=3572 RepID=A0AAW1N621_SAPOF
MYLSADKKGKYAVKVKGVEMNPDPVVSGEEAKFKISATSGKSITGGEVTITVYFHGIFVHSEKIDLCQETPCPIAPGDFVLSHVQTLPGITPAGPYSLKMSISGNDNELLTCIRFPFKIVRDSQAYVSEI